MKNEIEKFDIIAMNGKNESLTFYDPTLIEHTRHIMQLRDAGNYAMLGIAYEFGEMDKDESYARAGFKSVADYGLTVFDYKRSTVSLYTKVGKYFLVKTEDGFDIDERLPKLTVSQMIELLPLVDENGQIDDVVEAFQTSRLNSRMTTKTLRDSVKGIKGIPTKASADDKEHKEPVNVSGKSTEAVESIINSSDSDFVKLAKIVSAFDFTALHSKEEVETIAKACDIMSETISAIQAKLNEYL